jgi:dipeptidyl aminopeptidase/acylaminoacyl peptidase
MKYSGGQNMKNIDSHIVLITGLKDKRVNHHNSQFYYKRLLALKKSCEYFTFPCSNHNLASPKATLFDLEKLVRVLKKFKK